MRFLRTSHGNRGGLSLRAVSGAGGLSHAPSNPGNMFDFAGKLETGILDPVTERGPIFVDVD
jgi:hypothetical protein